MTTITLWLLVNVGYYGSHTAQVVERFAAVEECQRVLNSIRESTNRSGAMRCIQATVARMKEQQ